jgi:hypothetical protein
MMADTCADAAFYFGIQTDVLEPRLDHGIGYGLIFSTWHSFSLDDLRIEHPDGFHQLGTHEGNFIGVRRPFEWTAGAYWLCLERREEHRDGDWFALSIQPTDAERSRGEPVTTIGCLRFPRRNPDVPASIRRDGITFLEVYSGADTFVGIEPWRLRFMAYGDGIQAQHARSEYPPFPYAEVPNTDAFFSPDASLVEVAYGGATPRLHDASVLW